MTGFHSRASCQQYLPALLQRTTPENRRTPREGELTVSYKFTLYVLMYLSCRGICIFELATFYARRIVPYRPTFAFYRRSIWLQQSLKCLLWRQNVNYVNVSKYLIVISLVVSSGLACGSLRSVAVSSLAVFTRTRATQCSACKAGVIVLHASLILMKQH